MADEKVRIGFDGRPLVVPTAELGPDDEAFVDTTQWAVKGGGWATEGADGRYYLVDGEGAPMLDRPIGEDQLA